MSSAAILVSTSRVNCISRSYSLADLQNQLANLFVPPYCLKMGITQVIKCQAKFVADNILFFIFHRKYLWTFHVNCQELFSVKDYKKKIIRCRLLQL